MRSLRMRPQKPNVMRKTLACLLLTLTSLPAFAGQDGSAQPRLVPGGLDLIQGDKRVELLNTQQGLSIGAVSPLTSALPSASSALLVPSTASMPLGGAQKLAAGGYVAYSFQDMALSSAVRTRESAASADLSALYSPSSLGIPGTAALTLGYDWPRSSTFSLNTHAPGQDMLDPLPHGTSLSLSWNQSITPSLYLGGFASAIHTLPAPDDLSGYNGNAFRLGASLGVKF